ncbi:MAG TPA: LPS assembly lipoprotein LptE [Anaeromyxobacteraceae bacterium]|jgi:hypothetical protein|nr:LPS assembly lipoprotein LptE [Anaeromyxobacteraceae bacterium]
MSRPVLLAAALFALSGCGYGFTAGAARLPPGAEKVFVPPFDNRTAEPEAGAWIAGALRQELARRGAAGRAGDRGRIEGEVEVIRFLPTSGTTFQLTVAARARLVVDGKLVGDQPFVRQEDYVAGQDPLETEGRRRLALRRAAESMARDVVERFERP